MDQRRRRSMLALGAVALTLVAINHPKADIRILTHDTADVAPKRFQAAVDLGLMGVSVLVTWTAKRLR